MCKNLSPKMWKRIADSLRERNNHGQLCCLEYVVDVCRAFGLTFYVSLTPLPLVMPRVRIY